ncbi:hypothetical protein A9Q86_10475 [Flavobacteriales bacterium 33_180_T64]|nr:hypothetical protein A9Q86_10475 [Flavobacteriales bacterium 33_180_T64]
MKHLFSITIFFLSLSLFAQEITLPIPIESEEESVSLTATESIPIYKDCENRTTNLDKKKCMSEKVGQLIQSNFNTILDKNANLNPGMISISVIFKINKQGNVVDVKAKGPHPSIEKEAVRVIKMIPQMTPGMLDGKPVKVPYALPLKVEMTASKHLNKTNTIIDKSTAVYPIFRSCNEGFNYENAKRCTSKKIIDFIKLNFDYEMADRVFPLEQSTKFQLDFIINKKGKIEQVNAKANHKAIAIEAIRLAKRLPKFKKPGTIDGKPVDVPFRLLMTIYFQ